MLERDGFNHTLEGESVITGALHIISVIEIHLKLAVAILADKANNIEALGAAGILDLAHKRFEVVEDIHVIAVCATRCGHAIWRRHGHRRHRPCFKEKNLILKRHNRA